MDHGLEKVDNADVDWDATLKGLTCLEEYLLDNEPDAYVSLKAVKTTIHEIDSLLLHIAETKKKALEEVIEAFKQNRGFQCLK